VLTDTGNSYISKFYSDEWMRDNGFVVDEKGLGRVGDLIRERQPTVHFARTGQHIDEVVDAMRRHGISQMPVKDGAGRAMGMIHEYDLLNALVAKTQRFVDPIDTLVAPLQGVVSPEASLSALRDVFSQDNVAVVKEHEEVVAIITKIDLIEFLAARM